MAVVEPRQDDRFLKKNLRLILVVAGIVAIIAYNFVFFGGLRIPKTVETDDYLLLSTCWIQSSLLFGMVVCGLVITLSFFTLLSEWESEGAAPQTTLTPAERKSIKIGLKIGFVLFLALLGFLIAQHVALRLTVSALAFVSILVTLTVYTMDHFLLLKDIAKKVDRPILISVILVNVLYWTYRLLRQNVDLDYDPWVLGFAAGAIAFQMMLGNVLFDPARYTWSNLTQPRAPQGGG